MLVQALALLVFLAFVGALFRFAMGLRFAKTAREAARAAEEARGRRVVAEVPVNDSEVVFLVEDEARFLWGPQSLAKSDIAGGRLLVNGAIAGEFAREPGVLPPATPDEDPQGRERWDVVVYRRSGGEVRIPCGSLREGISREIAGRVFAAIRAAAEGEQRGGGGA